MSSLSIENLQALVILAFDDLGSGANNRAWTLIGVATRAVQYLQLTKEQTRPDFRPFCAPYAPLGRSLDWTEDEDRRRVFWCVFLLDRLCTTTTGRSTSLVPEKNRRLPCDDHVWRKQEAVSTPAFGLWDKSRGHDYDPAHLPVTQDTTDNNVGRNALHDISQPQAVSATPSDMSTVGAFAYNIEATESMSRVMTQFSTFRSIWRTTMI